MSKLVKIMIKDTFVSVDGVEYCAGTIFDEVSKYIDAKGRTCYKVSDDKAPIIFTDDNVIELGFINDTIFSQLESINEELINIHKTEESIKNVINEMSTLMDDNFTIIEENFNNITSIIERLNEVDQNITFMINSMYERLFVLESKSDEYDTKLNILVEQTNQINEFLANKFPDEYPPEISEEEEEEQPSEEDENTTEENI